MTNDFSQIPKDLRWRSQEQPAPIIISIIHRENSGPAGEGIHSYLLIKRKKGPYRDYWALVGGKWDFGETLSEAALREVAEETGLHCSFNSLAGIANERARTMLHEETNGAHFLIFVCQVDACDGTAEEQREGKVSWFSETELAKLNEDQEIIPSDYAMLSQFMYASALPFVEIDMESSAPNRSSPRATKLLKFEVHE